MQRLLLTTVGRLVLESVPLPVPGAGESLFRVEACALCRTDARLWQEGHRELVLPRVLGHEVCVRDSATGARAVLWPGKTCGKCRFCRSGSENLCPEMTVLGFSRDGGLGEWLAAPLDAAIAVPAHVPAAVAALAEPLACVLNGLERLELGRGESLLVYGAGPLGLLAGYAALAVGADPFLVEPDAAKQARSRAFRDGLGIVVGDRLPRRDFAAALNAVSVAPALAGAVAHLRPGGRLCLFSGLRGGEQAGPDLFVALNELHYRQLSMLGAYGCTRAQMRAAVAMLAAAPARFATLIERYLDLDQVPGTMPDVAAGRVLRCVVEMRGDTTA